MSRPFELLVFDWDGTLMDSIGTIVECTRCTLVELGMEQPEIAKIRGTIGLGLRETIDSLFSGCDEALYSRILEVYRAHWLRLRHQPLLFPGIPEMLEQLAGEGYRLAVATGKSRRGLDYAFGITGLGARFHASRTADETQSKPHPRMLLELLDELGVASDAALVVGDTTYDVEMAQSAGVAALAVLSGSQSRAEIEPLRPLAILEAATELPGWLTRSGERRS